MRGVLAVVGVVLLLPACGSEEVSSSGDDVCTADLRTIGGNEHEVHNPTWSPDGTRIAFDLFAGDRTAIYAVTVADCSLERLGPRDESVHPGGPDWSSTELLAFDGTEAGTSESGIYTMKPDGTDLRRLTDGPDFFPEWSPDGSSIAFVRDIVDEVNAPLREDRNVWVMNADGSGERRITRGRWHGSATWTADGERLVVDADAVGVIEIGADGSGRRVLLEGDFTNPIWSPDGKVLLLDGLRIAKRGAPPVVQLETPSAFGPEWSPDGDWIAFTDGENEADLWLVRPDGSGLRQLTRAR